MLDEQSGQVCPVCQKLVRGRGAWRPRHPPTRTQGRSRRRITCLNLEPEGHGGRPDNLRQEPRGRGTGAVGRGVGWEFGFSFVGELPGGEGKWPRGRYALGPGLSQDEVGVSILFLPSFLRVGDGITY